ncbi:MAG: peptide deformylase [Tissierellales bacterium]|nr:peptide deformylase [Tissierellales bacterium]
MALRNLRLEGDEILRKQSREIKNINERIKILADDMIETMKENDGIGLAAPQVGILKRIIVVDIGQGPLIMVNPDILEKDGEQIINEGCLSVPNKNGNVKRPEKLKVTYTDLEGDKHTIKTEGLLSVVISHEVDHLNGVLFIDKVIEEDEIKEGVVPKQ